MKKTKNAIKKTPEAFDWRLERIWAGPSQRWSWPPAATSRRASKAGRSEKSLPKVIESSVKLSFYWEKIIKSLVK